MKFIQFIFDDASFGAKYFVAPYDDFISARNEDIKLLRENFQYINDMFQISVDAEASRDHLKNKVINSLMCYAHDINRSYIFYLNEGGFSDSIININLSKLKDKVWWNRETIGLNLDINNLLDPFYEKDKLNKKYLEHKCEIMETYYFKEDFLYR